jgi:hypothetical protein
MGRTSKIVKVPRFEQCKNRDEGKNFLIVEWSAARADRWMQQVVFAFNKGAGELPMGLRGVGWEGIAIIGINTFLRGNVSSAEMMPLFDELFECVKVIRDPKHPEVFTEIVSDDDIEEVPTRWWLRNEVVSVHINFSPLAALSRLMSSVLTREPEEPSLKTTRTSRRSSGS